MHICIILSDQVYSNTRVPTQVNTSQHETTRDNMNPKQVLDSSQNLRAIKHEALLFNKKLL